MSKKIKKQTKFTRINSNNEAIDITAADAFRHHNTVALMSKEMRKLLQIDGEDVVELNMTIQPFEDFSEDNQILKFDRMVSKLMLTVVKTSMEVGIKVIPAHNNFIMKESQQEEFKALFIRVAGDFLLGSLEEFKGNTFIVDLKNEQ